MEDRTDLDEAIAQVRQEFCASLPVRLQAMRVALEKLSADFEQASAETFFLQAHSLKGTAGAFKANELQRHANVLAEIARGWWNREPISDEAVERAEQELAILTEAVERYVRQVERGGGKER